MTDLHHFLNRASASEIQAFTISLVERIGSLEALVAEHEARLASLEAPGRLSASLSYVRRKASAARQATAQAVASVVIRARQFVGS